MFVHKHKNAKEKRGTEATESLIRCDSILSDSRSPSKLTCVSFSIHSMATASLTQLPLPYAHLLPNPSPNITNTSTRTSQTTI